MTQPIKVTSINIIDLNMKFYPHYLLGNRIRVVFADGSERSGKVGVTQSKIPTFVLISKAGVCSTLGPGCTYLGPAMRKTRIDTLGYLQGITPIYHEERRKNGKG